ncbi:hypothetical protein NL676_007217 [Syzygium grande]|nr:hypothetical protein NL676_007217 [Syzygium grande]
MVHCQNSEAAALSPLSTAPSPAIYLAASIGVSTVVPSTTSEPLPTKHRWKQRWQRKPGVHGDSANSKLIRPKQGLLVGGAKEGPRTQRGVEDQARGSRTGREAVAPGDGRLLLFLLARPEGGGIEGKRRADGPGGAWGRPNGTNPQAAEGGIARRNGAGK